MEQCCVQIVEMHLVLHRIVTVLVRGSVAKATFDASPGHPHRKAFGIVIATVGSFGGWRTPKLSTPEHQGVVQHAPLFEVSEKACDRAIYLSSILFVALL